MTTTPLGKPPVRTFTGRHMLALTLGGFALVIAVNITMAFFATHTFPGLVVENSYGASQNYNQMIADGRRQDDAGWRAELSADGGRLSFTLRGGKNDLIEPLQVNATAGRPSTTREDRMLVFAAAGRSYLAEEVLPDGLWEIDVEAYSAGTLVFRQTREILIRQGVFDGR